MKYLIISWAIALCMNLSAQVGSPNVLDGSYTPPKSSVLGSEQTSMNLGSAPPVANKHSLRYSVSSFARFNIKAIYEFNIIPQLSITIGGGKPVGKDWILWLFEDEMWGSEKGIIAQETDMKYMDIVRNSNFHSGFLYSGSIRYYPKKSSFYDLSYLEIGVENVRRVYKLCAGFDNGDAWVDDYERPRIYVSPNNNEITDITSVFFNTGNQWNSKRGKLKFSHEMSLGVGVKYLKYHSYKMSTINVLLDKQIDSFVAEGPRVKDIIPYIGFSYNIGIGWRNN